MKEKEASERTSRSRIGSMVVNLGLLAGSFLLGLVICEVVVRIVAPMPPAVSWVRSDGLVLHKPGLRATYARQEFRTEIRINRDGFRGPEISREKPSGVLRVLVLGDSYAEGMQVPWKDLVSTRLERRINAEPGPRVEFVNVGVSGYGTTDELLLLEKLGWNYNPDLVLLAFCIHNDVSDNLLRPLYDFSTWPPTRNEAPPPGKAALAFLRFKGFLARHSQLYQLLRLRILRGAGLNRTMTRWGLRRTKGNVPARKPGRETLGWVSWFQDPSPPVLSRGLEYTRLLLKRMREECEAHRAGFLVVWIPLRAQVVEHRWRALQESQGLDPAGRSHPQELLSQLADDLGIEAVDLLPSFLEDRSGRPLYYEIDGHWTSNGHRVAAETLTPVLQAWRRRAGNTAFVP